MMRLKIMYTAKESSGLHRDQDFAEEFKSHLLNLPMPEPVIIPLQRKILTPENIGIQKPVMFKPAEIDKLLKRDKSRILAFDIGGTNPNCALVINGRINENSIQFIPHVKGKGIVTWIKKYIQSQKDISGIGFSIATEILPDGMLTIGSNIDNFYRELISEIGTANILDFTKRLIGTAIPISAFNDGTAGAMSAVFNAYRKNHDLTTLYYLIYSTGIGGAYWNKYDMAIYPSELGHGPLAYEMNKFHIKTPCKIHPEYICLENAGSRRIGLGKLLKKRMAEKEIHLFDPGQLAAVYDFGARIATHSIDALVQMDIGSFNGDNSAFVYHGGGFKAAGFAQRVTAMLEKQYRQDGILSAGQHLNAFRTYDFSPNACLEGAALSTLLTAKKNFGL